MIRLVGVEHESLGEMRGVYAGTMSAANEWLRDDLRNH
jgi:hypothetical protein